jgi:hypothetical protein
VTLFIDGKSSGVRLSVEFDGRRVWLRMKSFKYLLALAAARHATVDGWIHKTDIEPGDNQIRYVYQLRRELTRAGVRGATQNLIENDRLGRYRLMVPVDKISLDAELLRRSPDADIRRWAVTNGGMQ